MTCKHPKAARVIRVIDGQIRTVCWACEVERELRNRDLTNAAPRGTI